jgi:hypothetical protein
MPRKEVWGRKGMAGKAIPPILADSPMQAMCRWTTSFTYLCVIMSLTNDEVVGAWLEW